MNILIVDDNPTNLKLLRAVLEAEGHRVLEAPDGVEALATLERERRVDAIISDILMPNMDGYRLCYEVRRSERFGDLPFIFYTNTYISPGDEKLAKDMGADKYLRKPASPADILAALEAVSRLRTPRRPKSGLSEADVLREYNERLVNKLEQKQIELLERNAGFESLRAQMSFLFAYSPAVLFTLKVEGEKLSTVTVRGNTGGLLGVAPESTSYEWWLGSLHPEDRDRVLATVATGLKQGGCRMEYRLRHADGTYRWIEERDLVVRGADDQPEAMVGVWTEITERKRAEEELATERNLLRVVLDNVPDLIFTKDKEGRFGLCNVALCRSLGLSTEADLVGKTVFDLYDRSYAKGYHADDQGVFQTGQPILNREESAPDSAGVPRHVLTTKVALRDPDGAITGLLGITRDITERRAMEEQLRKLSVAVEQSPMSVVITDLDGRIEYVNPKFVEINGYTAAEAIGQNPRFLRTAETPTETHRQLWATLLAGQVWRGEFCNRKKSGETYWALAVVSPVRGKDGRATHFLAIEEDITGRKQLEAQTLRSQRLESIGALAGGVAHDLNNALAPVLMSVQLLEGEPISPAAKRLLDTIHSSARRAADMVQQILTFSRGSQGARRVVQIGPVFKEIADISRHTFPRNVQIQVEVAAGIWTVLANPTQLHQILLNCCVNARDAMPRGGTLALRASNVHLDEVYTRVVPGGRAGSFVMLTIADTGTGMTPEVRDRMFDPFFTTKAAGQGTGLGLSTVQNLVKQHAGFLAVDTKPGQGTTFKIYLPAMDSPPASREEVALLAVPLGNQEVVLVVDDEAAITSIAAQALQAYRYQVLTANDGVQALAICTERLADLKLVIMDINMPIIDGIAAIRVIRKLAPGMKFIVASGAESLPDSALAAELGIQRVLQKPFTGEQLLLAVHEVLQGK